MAEGSMQKDIRTLRNIGIGAAVLWGGLFIVALVSYFKSRSASKQTLQATVSTSSIKNPSKAPTLNLRAIGG